MEIGKLRHYVTIEYPAESFNTDGELVTTWTQKAKVWASIEPLLGKEYWESKQVVSTVTGKIRMRYLSGMTEKMRVVSGDNIYGIEAIINPEQRNIELILLVRKE